VIARPLEAYAADPRDVRANVDQVKAGMRAALEARGVCTVEDGGGGPWSWRAALELKRELGLRVVGSAVASSPSRKRSRISVWARARDRTEPLEAFL
jgi:hypothetical protein